MHKVTYAALPLLALLRLADPGLFGVALGVAFLFGSLMSNVSFVQTELGSFQPHVKSVYVARSVTRPCQCTSVFPSYHDPPSFPPSASCFLLCRFTRGLVSDPAGVPQVLAHGGPSPPGASLPAVGP